MSKTNVNVPGTLYVVTDYYRAKENPVPRTWAFSDKAKAIKFLKELKKTNVLGCLDDNMSLEIDEETKFVFANKKTHYRYEAYINEIVVNSYKI